MSENEGFELRTEKGVGYYIIPSFEGTNLVRHGFTTRIGGVSPEPFDNLNLGLKTEDEKQNVMDNFQKLSRTFNVPIEKMVLSDQTHGTNIRIVTKADSGKGLVKALDYKDVDGLLTNEKDVMLLTFYADCVPIFYLDKVNKVIGVSHAGWKGTVAKIAEKMIKKMINTYNSNPEDILVGIGPSIGPCCYTVKKDLYEEFNKNFSNGEDILNNHTSDLWKLDLWKANKTVLEENGILSRNITISKLCTSCNNDKLFSYRKENGITGRMAALIKLL